MKKLILLVGFLLAIASFANASPISCTNITLQTALAQGSSGCVLDNLLFVFSSYSFTAQNGAAPGITDGSDVNLVEQPGNPNTLTFQTADWSSRGNSSNPLFSQVRTIDIVYSVETAPSVGLITSLKATFGYTGLTTRSAECTAGCGSVVDFTSGMVVPIGPLPGPITIEDHIVLGGTQSTSSGHVSILTNAFEVASEVPEPGVTLLTAGGLLFLGLVNRKRSARS